MMQFLQCTHLPLHHLTPHNYRYVVNLGYCLPQLYQLMLRCLYLPVKRFDRRHLLYLNTLYSRYLLVGYGLLLPLHPQWYQNIG